MPRTFIAFSLLVVGAFVEAAACQAAPPAESAGSPPYRLAPTLRAGDAAKISVSLEVGGELIVRDQEGQQTRLPLSVVAEFAYEEELAAWWADAGMSSRSLRRYSRAKATIKSSEKGDTVELEPENRLIVAKATAEGGTINGLKGPLTRREFDLLDVVGNSLLIDRLLPNKELREGEGWDHDAATMGAVLGMDHVAICEVRSVVTGESNRQVQIRMAGTVEGAASEMDLRGAYLFHLDEGRITKLNLAIKEVRKPAEVSPGLDIVAKLSLVASPLGKQSAPFDEPTLEKARQLTPEQLGELYTDSPQRGYRFRHDSSWYVTAEHRELMSLRYLDGVDMISHCNITTLPPRPADKPMTLAQFEADVVRSLGDKVEKVAAATEWANEAGHQCLGVIVAGQVEGTPVQWRHYYVGAEGLRPAMIAVTLEQPMVGRFHDADRPIVESMVLLPPPAATATKLEPVKK